MGKWAYSNFRPREVRQDLIKVGLEYKYTTCGTSYRDLAVARNHAYQHEPVRKGNKRKYSRESYKNLEKRLATKEFRKYIAKHREEFTQKLATHHRDKHPDVFFQKGKI